MRTLFSLTCWLVVATAVLGADGDEAVNRLTPEEAAAGWNLLFDGNQLQQWQIAGTCTAANGTAQLTGDSFPRIDYGQKFELRFEYQLGGGVAYVMAGGRKGFFGSSFGGSGLPPEPTNGWQQVVLTGEPEGGGWRLRRHVGAVGAPIELTVVNSLPRRPEDVLLVQVAPGSTLTLRNVKFRGAPGKQSSRLWVIGGLVVLSFSVAGLSGWVLYRRARRDSVE
jgi:hypothetical protein